MDSRAGAPRVLVIDDEAALRAMAGRALEREGFEVAEAPDAGEALGRFRSFGPAVTVVDVGLPDRSGIELLAELRGIDPLAAFIVVTGGGDEQTALRAGAASFLHKPFPISNLVQEVRRLAAWRATPAPGAAEVARTDRRCFGTADARDVSGVSELTLPLRGLLEESALLGVRIGIGEMIANAVEHGNLGITAAEKEAALAEGRFSQIVASRLADPANAAKRVWVESRLADGEFRVTVRDEGAGFDWRALASAVPGVTLAGRGVLLARFHFDEVRWNEAGNEVTLTKRIPVRG
jgi:CheY-like chemotaxis protein